MLGVSLSPELLASCPRSDADNLLLGEYGDVAALLAELKSLGVSSVELRTVRVKNASLALPAAKAVVDAGLGFTVHGAFTPDVDAVESVLDPLAEIFAAGLVSGRLTVTLHPIASGTVDALRRVCAEAESRGMDIAVALENNRTRPDGQPGDTCPLVSEILAEVALPNVGACFDMGHYFYNVKKYMNGNAKSLPSGKFLRSVIHTHIHAVEDMTTHFPLDRCELPLKYYCDALGSNVCYNLELDAPRYFGKYDPKDALVGSIEKLRAAIPTLAVARENLVKNARTLWENGLNLPEDHFTLLGPSSYVINLGGKIIAVDPNIRDRSLVAPMSATVARYADVVDYVVLTHEHNDHYDPEVLRLMTSRGAKVVAPDFFDTARLSTIVDASQTVRVADGETLDLDGVSLDAFRSLHYRVDGTGVDEFGYRLTAQNGRTLLLVGDIRDYDAERLPTKIRGADNVFAHVWLGDNVCLDRDYLDPMHPMVCGFAEFFVKLTDGNPTATLYFSHLFESGRDMKTMWSNVHAGALMDAVYVRNPSLDCVIARMGKYYPI